MKKRTKTLLTLLCAALLVAVSVIGTYAYLVSQDTVTNTFTVGNVQIKLDEAKVNPDGTPVEPAERVKANSYHLLPGHSYTKDPTVTVEKGSEECYVRMLVTVNNVSELKAIFDPGNTGNFNLEAIFTGHSSDWQRHSITPGTTDNTVVYEYWYKEKVAKNADAATKLPALFTGIALPGTLTNAQLETIAGLEINITAHAIQADGFADAQAAWDAFPTTTNS